MRITLLASALAGLLATASSAWAQPAPDAALIERGHQVAIQADCAACHTAKGGADLAGGYPVASPLGTIWSTNITPSPTAGIGGWSEQDFSRALRQGVLPDGTHLYPAMPYDAYAGITDDDVHALYAYLMHGVKAVDTPPKEVTALPFPFNIRMSMMGWNLLFARQQPFTPDPKLTAQQNRGAYLVNALEHCGTCHTPRGLLMQSLGDQAFGGAAVGRWYAPNITPGPDGIGHWSEDDIVTYLKTGRLVGHAQAGGPMAEAVEHSLQHVSDDDLHAIAAYLKVIPAVANPPGAPGGSHAGQAGTGAPRGDEAAIRGVFSPDAHNSLATGAELYSGYCASCHQPDGAGSTNQAYPSLVANNAARAANPTNLIATMLDGVDRQVGNQHVLMPAFGPGSYVTPLRDDEIAKIATYVRQTFGGQQAVVTAADVAQVRAGGPVPFLAKIQPYIPSVIIAGVVVAVLVLLALWRVVSGRKRHRAG